MAELAFPFPVEAIWARPDRVAVAAGHRVYVYTLDDLSLQDVVDVAVPYRMLMSLPTTGSCVLLTPGARHTNSAASDRLTGVVTLPTQSAARNSGDVTLQNYASLPVSHVDIVAHDHQLTCVAANAMGTMFATSSLRGTLVRVYAFKPLLDLHDRVIVRGGRRVPLVAQFRRARQTSVTVCSLSFSHDCEFLAAGCEDGSVNVFPLADACRQQTKFSLSELGLPATVPESSFEYPPLIRVSFSQTTRPAVVQFAPTLIKDSYALFAAAGGFFFRVMLDRRMAVLSVSLEGVYRPPRTTNK